MLGKQDIHTEIHETRPISLTLYKKMNSEGVKDLNIRYEMVREKSREKNFKI